MLVVKVNSFGQPHPYHISHIPLTFNSPCSSSAITFFLAAEFGFTRPMISAEDRGGTEKIDSEEDPALALVLVRVAREGVVVGTAL